MNTAGPEDGSIGPLREALAVCAAAGMSGVLRVTGDPGGAIHLVDGRIAAIETPGAPSAEVILIRSHRVTSSGSDTAFRAAAASGKRMSSELIARQMAGAGELEVLLWTTLADAMFVMASGTVQEYRAEPGPVDAVLPLEPGAEPGVLLAEASRRIRVLASLPAWLARDRVVAAPGAAWPHVRIGEGQDEILALADGHRTPRNLAFALGRGVYATMLQLARMRQAGLLGTAFYQGAASTADGGPEHTASVSGVPAVPGLPHRQQDQRRRLRVPGQAPELRVLLGLLRLRSRQNIDASETP